MVRNIYPGLLKYIGLLVLPMLLTACFGGQAPQPERDGFAYTDDLLDLDVDWAIDNEMISARDNPGALVDNPSSATSYCDGECLADRMEIGDVSIDLTREKDPGLDLVLSGDLERRRAVSETGRKTRLSKNGGKPLHRASVPSGAVPRPANEKAAMCDGRKIVCISSPFGVKRPGHIHKGVDISAPFGSPIKAFRSGVVIDAKRHHSYGNVVDIQQNDGLISRYAHMSQILVKPGESVWQGQIIGRVGSTGRSSGPHLHFELIRGNMAMNPMLMLASPNHVVAAATANDAEHARMALKSSGYSTGSRRAAYRDQRRVVDRHMPAKGKWSAGKVGKSEKTKKKVSDGKIAGRSVKSDKKVAASKSGKKNPLASQKKVSEKGSSKKGQKLLASNERRAQGPSVREKKKSSASKSDARSGQKSRASSKADTSSKKSAGKAEKKKAASASRQAKKAKK